MTTKTLSACCLAILSGAVAVFVAFFPPFHRIHPTSQDVAGIHLGESRDQVLAGHSCESYQDMTGEDAMRCSDPKGQIGLTLAHVHGEVVVAFVGLDAAVGSRDACDGALDARYGMDTRTRDFATATLPQIGTANFLAGWSDLHSVCQISAYAIDLDRVEMDHIRAVRRESGRSRL